MTPVLFIAPAVVAALLAYALTPVARRVALATGAVDRPGPRKIHSVATPRLGGLAVLVSSAIVFTAAAFFSDKVHSLPPEFLVGVAAGLAPIVVISIIDDIRPQRAIVKFITQIAGASIAVALGIRLNPSVHFLGNEISIGWLSIAISILWLAGITNAFNLIDGLDGLSAGLALISSISLAAVSVVTKNYDMAVAAAILAGSLVGFLPFNVYPAKIYLGDAGANTIGFFLGALTLRGGATTSAGLAVTLPVVVLGIPLADTLLSMVRRLIRRTTGGLFAADENHIHHRLLALGLDHRRAVLTLYAIGIGLSLFGFTSLFMTHQNAALLLGALLIGALVGVSRLGYDEFAMVKSGALLKVYQAPVLKKGFFVVFVDMTIVASALYATLVLKYDDWSVQAHRDMALAFAAVVPAVILAMFAGAGIYKRSWANASVEDVVKLSTAIIAGSFTSYVIARFTSPEPPPATFLVTFTFVLLVFANGSRASYRFFQQWHRRSNRTGDPVVIYGAGIGGTLALREMLANSEVPMKPIGFIDDNPLMKGRVINGYPVLGGIADLETVVADSNARGVVIASEKIPVGRVQSARDICESAGAWMRIFSINFRSVEDGSDAA